MSGKYEGHTPGLKSAESRLVGALEVARYVSRLEAERATLLAQRDALAEALRKAREYVAAVHAQVAGASGKTDNLVSPDLAKINAALALLESK